MPSVRLALAPAIALLLCGCASTDHSAALALGNAGVTATQALSDQTASLSQTVGQLAPLWGVRDALVCASVKADPTKSPEPRATCIRQATATPNPALAKQLQTVSDVLTKRKKALDTLNQAYSAFVDLAKYNAGQEASAALATSFTDVNAFVSAASALVPGGVAVKAISPTIEQVAGGVTALVADSRQNQQIRAANRDLKTASDAMTVGLTAERNATASLLAILQDEKANLGVAVLNAGMVSPTDALTQVINQALPTLKVSAPPAANADVVLAAARNALVSQRQAGVAEAPKSYDDALGALKALSAQHQKLDTDQKPDLSELEAEIANLQADIAQMKPAPTASATPAAAK